MTHEADRNNVRRVRQAPVECLRISRSFVFSINLEDRTLTSRVGGAVIARAWCSLFTGS